MWVGLADSAAAAWFVHHLVYLTVVLPLDSAWTSHSAVCFILPIFLSESPFLASLPHFPASPLSLPSLALLLFSPFLPLLLLHPSPRSRSDAMPLCCESRGRRFNERAPKKKVWDHTLHCSFSDFFFFPFSFLSIQHYLNKALFFDLEPKLRDRKGGGFKVNMATGLWF